LNAFPIKVGVLIIGLKGKIESALKYLILAQNTRQKSLEFLLLSLPKEVTILSKLEKIELLLREDILEDINEYESTYIE